VHVTYTIDFQYWQWTKKEKTKRKKPSCATACIEAVVPKFTISTKNL